MTEVIDIQHQTEATDTQHQIIEATDILRRIEVTDSHHQTEATDSHRRLTEAIDTHRPAEVEVEIDINLQTEEIEVIDFHQTVVVVTNNMALNQEKEKASTQAVRHENQ
jgi:hypothetical protein